MFGLGKKKHWTRSKDPESKRYRQDMAAHLNGKGLKCVSERVNGVEELVGKSGAIIVKDDELLMYAGQEVVFRCKILDMKAWELMSLDGVNITACDLEHGGKERSVVAYYSYWRRMDD